MDELQTSNLRLSEQLLALPQVKQCSSILLYYGVGQEPDTLRILETLGHTKKVVALPRCCSRGIMEARQYLGAEHLTAGTFGIPEPDTVCPVVNRDDLSLILVPGLCFDQTGFRLGHGGGYYDRYLSQFSGLTVALCRDRLLFPSIPVEPHDQPVDLILTETQCFSTSQ